MSNIGGHGIKMKCSVNIKALQRSHKKEIPTAFSSRN